VDVWRREALIAGQIIRGPALVTEKVSTTYIAPKWGGYVDPHGNLLLERAPG
jgi:N-methylhydantoinase A